MAGCAFSVLVSTDCCSFCTALLKTGIGKITSVNRFFPSFSNIVSTYSKHCDKGGKALAISLPIPTYCDPCPENNATTFVSDDKPFARKYIPLGCSQLLAPTCIFLIAISRHSIHSLSLETTNPNRACCCGIIPLLLIVSNA